MKVKVEREKVGLKLNIQKMKIMASGPITSWEIDGQTVETVLDFIFFFIFKLYIIVLVLPNIKMTLFFGVPKSLQMVIAAMKLKDACSLEGKL